MSTNFRQLLEMPRRVYLNLPRDIRWSLLTAVGLMAVTGFLTSIPPVIIGGLTDQLFERKKDFSLLYPALNSIGLIALIIVIRETLQVFRKYLVENASTQLEKRLFVDAVAHTLQIDFSQAQTTETVGALNGRILRSVEGFVKLIKLGFLDFFPVLFAAGFSLVIAFYENWRVGIAMSLVIPVGLFIVKHQIKTQQGIRLELLRAKEKSDGRVVELLQGRDYVRAAHTEDIEIKTIENIAESLREKELKHHISMAFYDAWKYLNEGFFSIGVLLFSLFLFAVGIIVNPGDILKFTLLYASVLIPLRELHRIIDEAHESSIRVGDYFDLLDKPRDISYEETSGETAEPVPASKNLIEFRNVNFSYPGKNLLLDNIYFNIFDGEQVAFAGSSGSGKSTLLKLLLRLQHLNNGEIIIKGRDISTFSRKEIAELFGYVGQEPFLFAGTFYDNISYGFRGDLSPDIVIKAAKQANIHNEIVSLPDAYETELAEGGRDLSGGQRQRVAIARVFLRNPPILLLDEATSGLDIQNEQIVQEALNQAMRGRTVISISHRLSALQIADRVLVVDSGKITAEGSYEDLVNQNKIFAALVGLENKNGNDKSFTPVNNQTLKEELVF